MQLFGRRPEEHRLDGPAYARVTHALRRPVPEQIPQPEPVRLKLDAEKINLFFQGVGILNGPETLRDQGIERHRIQGSAAPIIGPQHERGVRRFT